MNQKNTKQNVRLVGAGLVPAHIKGKTQKGITLIALVITIIVLLILAGVTISMVLGDDGIIQNAQTAKQATKDAAIQEEINKIAMEKGMKDHGLTEPTTLPTSVDQVIERLKTKGIVGEGELEPDGLQAIKYKDGSKSFSLEGIVGWDNSQAVYFDINEDGYITGLATGVSDLPKDLIIPDYVVGFSHYGILENRDFDDVFIPSSFKFDAEFWAKGETSGSISSITFAEGTTEINLDEGTDELHVGVINIPSSVTTIELSKYLYRYYGRPL